MATITKEFLIAANPETVWDALRDFHAVHERVAPGFLTAATREGDDRILTFFNGMVARERLIGCDNATWISDILPDTLAGSSSAMMDHGSEAMIRTLTSDADTGFGS